MVHLRVPDEVQILVFGDGLLLRDKRTDSAARLNATGRLVLGEFANGTSADEVIASVATTARTDTTRATNEVRVIVGDLVMRGLLETVGEEAAPHAVPEDVLPFYPWYDSYWLAHYVASKQSFRELWPEGIGELDEMFGSLRTDREFGTVELRRFLDDEALQQIRSAVARLEPARLERHESERFGRGVVHNDPFFNEMQAAMVPIVSDLAGEALEVSYNFLSLYGDQGVCAPHMDAPNAKYTLDMCIDQSERWPIYISQVVPWPEDYVYPGDDWARALVESPELEFCEYVMDPGDALFFAGSSQFHYRDPLQGGPGSHSTLLFFHFVPKGMKTEVDAFAHWG